MEVVVTQPSFTEDDVRLLLGMAADIENIHPERCEEAWVAFASDVSEYEDLADKLGVHGRISLARLRWPPPISFVFCVISTAQYQFTLLGSRQIHA